MKSQINLSILAVAILLICFKSLGQCSKCISEFDPADYCYTNDLFEGICASFTEKSDYFYLRSGINQKKIPLVDTINLAYYKQIIEDKTLEVKTEELLIIQEALMNWEQEKKLIGYSFLESGLGIKVLEEGDGTLPEKGQRVQVHYTGTLEDGTKFDSSVDRNQPFEFQLGMGRVIRGWDEGVAQLKVGSKALLWIPSELGYGPRGAGGVIPPNATLIFEIQVLDIIQ